MDGTVSKAQLRSLGAQLAKYVRNRPGVSGHSISAMQSVIADLTADQPDLGPPLRDLVARAQFQTLIPLAASGAGEIQRNALIDEVRRIYHPDVVFAVQEVLNGFLECSGGSAAPVQRVPDPVAPAQAPPVSAAPARVSPAREAPLPRRQPLAEEPSIKAGSGLPESKPIGRPVDYGAGKINPDLMNYGPGTIGELLVNLVIAFIALIVFMVAGAFGGLGFAFAAAGVLGAVVLIAFVGDKE